MILSTILLSLSAPSYDWSVEADPVICFVNNIGGLNVDGAINAGTHTNANDSGGSGKYIQYSQTLETGDDNGICLAQGGLLNFSFDQSNDQRAILGGLNITSIEGDAPFGGLFISLYGQFPTNSAAENGAMTMLLMGGPLPKWAGMEESNQEMSDNRTRSCSKGVGDLVGDAYNPQQEYCVLMHRYPAANRVVNGQTPLYVIELGNAMASN